MATHTVTGCYNSTNGEVTFDDTQTGCTGATITGCYQKDGIHAGEIKITHDYDGCATQYYACYDDATGKFSFEADNECCNIIDPCGACCTVDSFASTECPKYMTMVINFGPAEESHDCFDGTYVGEGDGLGWEFDDGTDRFVLSFSGKTSTCVVSLFIVCDSVVIFTASLYATSSCSVGDFLESNGCDGDTGYFHINTGCDSTVTWFPSDSLGNPL